MTRALTPDLVFELEVNGYILSSRRVGPEDPIELIGAAQRELANAAAGAGYRWTLRVVDPDGMLPTVTITSGDDVDVQGLLAEVARRWEIA